jgi:hypothetical protein
VNARDAPVAFTVDRLIAPRSANRSTIAVVSGTSVRLAGTVAYDPARLAVTFVPEPGQMLAGIEYVLVVTTGLTAWDGTPLADPVARAFVAGTPVQPRPSPPSRPSLRDDVAPLLARRCGISGCHAGGAQSVMALDLSSAAAIVNTTVRVAARETALDTTQAGAQTDPRWGSLFRVDPGDVPGHGAPEYSYLFYKLEGAGPVQGARMPPSTAGPPLRPDEIQLISDWIARGAPDD